MIVKLIGHIPEIAAAIAVILIALSVWIFVQVKQGKRSYQRISKAAIAELMATIVLFGMFLYSMKLLAANQDIGLPENIVSGNTALMLAGVLAFGVLLIAMTYLFPSSNKNIQTAGLAVLTVIAGLANASIIFVIVNSFYLETPVWEIVYYIFFLLILLVVCKKISETRLVKFTHRLVIKLRIDLVDKIFHTSFEKFEQIDRGRIYATLNDDTHQISNSVYILLRLATGFVMVVGGFLYLSLYSLRATLLLVAVIGVLMIIHQQVKKKAAIYFEQVRTTQNRFFELLNGLIAGFKELSLSKRKRHLYLNEVEDVGEVYVATGTRASLKFVDAMILTDVFFVTVLVFVGIFTPLLINDLNREELMQFIMILLYLTGPITELFSQLPALLQVRVAYNRVSSFIDDLEPDIASTEIAPANSKKHTLTEGFEADALTYSYPDKNGRKGFEVGPISFSLQPGEVLFITGGNGSGKTTLMNILSGLYTHHSGNLYVDGRKAKSSEVGENYSAIFSDYHLLKTLYGVDTETNQDRINEWMKILEIEGKVTVKDGNFDTTDLSTGQKKRLALLKCYMENSPIYLFDEWASDQDPEFRRFFYRELIHEMRLQGKIVIAITHDDQYFDAADWILKMSTGKSVLLEKQMPNPVE